MKAKITLQITIDDETTVLFEKAEKAEYSDIEDLLNEIYVRGEEHISKKRLEELDND